MTQKTNIKITLLLSKFIQRIITLDRNEKACHGVTLSQHYALGAIARRKQISMNELSKELGIAISTLTRVIDVLVRDKVVKRVPSEQDRRKVLVTLTAKGEKVVEKLNQCTETFWISVLNSIPNNEKPKIKESLSTLLKALDNAESCCHRS